MLDEVPKVFGYHCCEETTKLNNTKNYSSNDLRVYKKYDQV